MKKPELKREQKAVKLSLSLQERINLAALFPPKSSLAGNALSKALQKKVDFTPEEKTEFKLMFFPNGKYVYDAHKAKDREFDFEPFELLHIQQGIRMHDMAETIDKVNQDLAERILSIKAI